MSATQTFTIDVLQPTSLAVAPAIGNYGSATTLSATLTAGGSPVADAAGHVHTGCRRPGHHGGHGDDRLERRRVLERREPRGPAGAAGYPSAAIASYGGGSSDAFSAASGGLTIARATPTVTWAAPADITQGEALGAAQLGATASVPGTLTYSPAVGAVLSAGLGQNLTAVFTPSDSTDYTSVSTSAEINVLPKAAPTVALSASTPTPLAGLPLTFTVLAAPPAPGDPTPTGTVQFEVDGSTVGAAVTLASGMATSVSITLTAGAHTITAVYSGDATYAGAPGVAHRDGGGSDRDGEGDGEQPVNHCRPAVDVHHFGRSLGFGLAHADGNGPVRG